MIEAMNDRVQKQGKSRAFAFDERCEDTRPSILEHDAEEGRKGGKEGGREERREGGRTEGRTEGKDGREGRKGRTRRREAGGTIKDGR